MNPVIVTTTEVDQKVGYSYRYLEKFRRTGKRVKISLYCRKKPISSRCTISGCSHCGKWPEPSTGTSRPFGRLSIKNSLSSKGTVLSVFPR